jgi:two-component system, chemotaxis family, protein-glutamate methylesterase/glutaminase
MDKKIQVLIVDDSALVRQTMSSILMSDPYIQVCATASDPYYAAKRIQNRIPDVITLDIEMPRMNGLTFLKKIMSQHPIPVVIVSSHVNEDSDIAIKALEYGAVEVVYKPLVNTKEALEESKIQICDAVKAAAISKISRKSRKIHFSPVSPNFSSDVILKKGTIPTKITTTNKIIVIGASTGGTETLQQILVNLPIDTPGIVIVQHMPEGFTKAFANRLNQICQLSVKEAESGDIIKRGSVLIAPGNKHLLLKRNGNNYYVELKGGPLVNRHRPSVDVLFRSAARYAGKNATGIILTGMGDDGAKGLLEMKETGSKTIAQNEKSCIIFGMPKAAISLNAASETLSLEEIINRINN